MIPKGEVNYMTAKERKNLYIALILSIIFIVLITTAVFIKLYVIALGLFKENQELNKAIDVKNSQIADLEENCRDLYVQVEELKHEN